MLRSKTVPVFELELARYSDSWEAALTWDGREILKYSTASTADLETVLQACMKATLTRCIEFTDR